MNSKSKVPCIPIEGSISWADWLKGRRYRREMGNLVAPAIIRRASSSKDKRLKKLYNGERGLLHTHGKALRKMNIAPAASIFHFGTDTVGEVKKFLAEKKW